MTAAGTFILPTAEQILVNRIGRFAAGTHGQDDGGRSGDDIAAGPDAFFIGLAGGLVGFDLTPIVLRQVRSGFGQ